MVGTSQSRRATVSTPSDTEILITREFDAEPHLVYRAWTTPELVARWWHGDQGSVTSIDIDLRVGGRWRYVMVANDGSEAAFHGDYREVVPSCVTRASRPVTRIWSPAWSRVCNARWSWSRRSSSRRPDRCGTREAAE
jgi:hypothetical protein